MEGRCYSKNFIKKVIAKIDFNASVDIFTPDTLADAVSEIKKRFPISEQKTGIQNEITFSNVGVEQSLKKEFPEWIFHGKDRTKVLKVNHQSIEVVLNKYDTENDFIKDVITPISKLLSINPNIVVQRTGIRFINIFDFKIDNFKKSSIYFTPSISANYTKMADVENCNRAIMINEFIKEDIKLRVQSGYFNPDYPAIIKRNHFLLDFDAYIDSPHLINNIEVLLKKLHDIIEFKFEELITDKLRDKVLNGR